MPSKKYDFLDTPAIKNELYRRWRGIKSRCSHPENLRYKNYAGRGIKVCDEWKNNFENFYYWAINNGYQEGLSIERIDLDKGYNPSNCIWIPLSEQSRNRRTSIWLEYKDEKMLLTDVAKKENLSPYSIVRLYNQHKDIYKAVDIAKKNKQGLMVTNKTGFVGIYQCGNKWEAKFCADNKTHYVGRFNTKEQAILSREQAIKEYKKE